jgi:hypothetical protein
MNSNSVVSFNDRNVSTWDLINKGLIPRWMEESWIAAGNASPRWYRRVTRIAAAALIIFAFASFCALDFEVHSVDHPSLGRVFILLGICTIYMIVVPGSALLGMSKLDDFAKGKMDAFGQALWPILTLLRPTIKPQAFPPMARLIESIEEALVDLAAHRIVFGELDHEHSYRYSEVYYDLTRLLEGAQSFGLIPRTVGFKTYFDRAVKSGRVDAVREIVIEDDKKPRIM